MFSFRAYYNTIRFSRIRLKGEHDVSDKNITALGWMIINRLAEIKMTRKQFCQLHDIPESRLSNLITGLRPAKRYRARVMSILQISESEFNA